MNALILPAGHLAHDLKASDRHGHVDGGSVFSSDFVRAVLRYGTFDRCYVMGAAGAGRRDLCVAACPDGDDRLVFVEDPTLLRSASSAVIADCGVNFHQHRVTRRLLCPSRRWPITGFIYSVSSSTVPHWFFQAVLGDVQPWDAIICPSVAGRRVVQEYLAAMPEMFPELAPIWPVTQMQLPVLPMGCSAPALPAGARARLRSELALEPDDVVLLYVGRLNPYLKCDLLPLLLAFRAVLASTRARAHLVIAGDDTRFQMASRLEQAAAQLGCGGRVTVRPDVTDAEKAALYAAADVFVTPSDNMQETFGLTIAEAMSAGLPVVASDWNGYRDLVADGDSGFLVPTSWLDLGTSPETQAALAFAERDGRMAAATAVDVGALARALERLVDEPELRRQMGARGRQLFAERFDWKVMVGRYEALWADLRAMADAAAPSSSASAERLLAFQRRFAHYPSTTIGDEHALSLGPTALSSAVIAEVGAGLPGPALASAAQIASVVADVADSTPITAGELVRRIRLRGASSDLTARLLLARLVKYGIVGAALPASTVDVVDRDHLHAATT